MFIMERDYRPCIRHSEDEPYVNLRMDYLRLHHGSYAQTAIMQLLEDAQGEWIPLSFDRFRPLAGILSVDEQQFLIALGGLIARGHVERDGDAFRLNMPVVQQALDEQHASEFDDL